jgi:hypothetical protein
VIATLIGAGFHLLLGGDARRLAMFLIAGWVGFALGQLVGDIVGLEIVFGFLDVGPLHMVTAVLGASAAAIFTHIVTSNKRSRRRS